MNPHDLAIWQTLGLGPVWVPRAQGSETPAALSEGVLLVGDFDAQTRADGALALAGKGGELLANMLTAIGWAHVLGGARTGGTGNSDMSAGDLPLALLPLADPIDARQAILQQGRRFLLVVGQGGVQAVWGADATLNALRGQVHALQWGEHTLQAAVLHAPATLLAQPALKRQAWEDLCLIRARFALPH